MQAKWTTVIQPKNSLLQVDFRELWQYRDLYRMLVKRDIVVWYKQTILGPLWFFIQPILTTIMFMIVFGGIAKIGTDGIPQPLFYLAGICLWNYFAESLNQTSNTFIQNSALFGKVYFPRPARDRRILGHDHPGTIAGRSYPISFSAFVRFAGSLPSVPIARCTGKIGHSGRFVRHDGKQHLAGKTKLQHLVGANMFAALHGMDAFILHPGRMPLAEKPVLEDIRHTDYCPHTDFGRLYQRIDRADEEQLANVS